MLEEEVVLKKLKIIRMLIISVVVLGSMGMPQTAVAEELREIQEIFPCPTLAELVAINLNLETSDVVLRSQLSDVLVLNVDADDPISDFTGIELLGLEHLYIDYHHLTSLEPFAELTSLRVLDIEGNEVSDLSPILNMTGLEVLRLGGNPIDQIDDLVHFPQLRELSLFETNVSDLSVISNLERLERLDISNINVGMSDLAELSGLTGLKRLVIGDVLIDGLDFLSNMTMLEELILFNNREISDLRPLSNMTSLTHLEVSNNRLEEISVLESLVNLERLSLAGNEIEDVRPLRNLRHLDHVNLSVNRISDVRPLSSLNATSLDVSGQVILLPEVEAGMETPFVVYGVEGSALPLELVTGNGMYTSGNIVWRGEGFGEFSWGLSSDTMVFNGSVMRNVWEDVDDETEGVADVGDETFSEDTGDETYAQSTGDGTQVGGRLPLAGSQAEMLFIVLGVAVVLIGFVFGFKRKKSKS